MALNSRFMILISRLHHLHDVLPAFCAHLLSSFSLTETQRHIAHAYLYKWLSS